MFKKAITTATLLLLLSPVFAQHSLLYKISGKGLSQPSYLYGTIHMVCPDDFSISEQLKGALQEAKTLYLEMDMDDPAMMAGIMDAMKDTTAGYKLESIFKPEDYTRLSKYFKDSLKMDITFFQQMKPMMILTFMLAKTLRCQTPSSYDLTLLTMAQAQKKPVEGLEAMEVQTKLFDRSADSTESRIIMEYVDDMEKQRAYFDRIVAAYKQQDINKIHDFIKDSPEMAGQVNEMLYDRNRNWIPVIEKAALKETTLFACGAMHLGGDLGVVALLRKQGYTVEAVSNVMN